MSEELGKIDLIEPGYFKMKIDKVKPVKLDDKSAKKKEPIKPVNISTLLTHKFPAREHILSPVFTKGSLNMVFAVRGIGKTHASLGIAYASAAGSKFWHWEASRPFKTLLIDGEMPGESLQERLAAIVEASDKTPEPDYFQVITIDLNSGKMPDLSTVAGQDDIEDACQEAELIIVDNLSCLCRSGRENEAESWITLSEWALRMRSLGKCVVFIHHAGKNGEQRGTSKREDILDVVIELKRPGDYEPDQGARFVVNFKKARHLTGNDAQSFEAWLRTDDHGNQVWTTKDCTESTFEQVVEMTQLGMSQTDIALELGINKSNVCRHVKKAKEQGLLLEKTGHKGASKIQNRRADVDG